MEAPRPSSPELRPVGISPCPGLRARSRAVRVISVITVRMPAAAHSATSGTVGRIGSSNPASPTNLNPGRPPDRRRFSAVSSRGDPRTQALTGRFRDGEDPSADPDQDDRVGRSLGALTIVRFPLRPGGTRVSARPGGSGTPGSVSPDRCRYLRASARRAPGPVIGSRGRAPRQVAVSGWTASESPARSGRWRFSVHDEPRTSIGSARQGSHSCAQAFSVSIRASRSSPPARSEPGSGDPPSPQSKNTVDHRELSASGDASASPASVASSQGVSA